jgi:hypothetical protein
LISKQTTWVFLVIIVDLRLRLINRRRNWVLLVITVNLMLLTKERD